MNRVSHQPNPELEKLLEPLFARGRVAFTEYIDGLPLGERPIGGSPLAIKSIKYLVTREDFAANSDLLFDHVVMNNVVLHVLCSYGAICAVFTARTSRF